MIAKVLRLGLEGLVLKPTHVSNLTNNNLTVNNKL